MATKTLSKNKVTSLNGAANGHATTQRLDVKKTYKLYVDGKFPRSESGRFLTIKDSAGKVVANYCRSSRKDLRDSVVSNRKAQEGWAKRSAYNKAQILYRIAETLEGRKAQFVETLQQQGMTAAKAKSNVEEAIDLLVYYAGWSDKYIQVFSAVNPVESSHFNFSFHEPSGVAMILSPDNDGLAGLVRTIAPVIVGGNACTVLVSGNAILASIELGEVMHASDLPGGVVNILTGTRKELVSQVSSHMDVNAVVYEELEAEHIKTVQLNAALNVKRVVDFSTEDARSPYRILGCQEVKTTWHPIGI